VPKTYLKHWPDPDRRPPIPDFATLCDRVVPPSEIVTRLPLVTCWQCRVWLRIHRPELFRRR